jgi:WD40 repeat protein
VTQLAFSPDGSQLAGGGGDRRVYVWDTVALELVRAISSDRERGEPLHRLAWLRDGSRLVTVRSGEPRALVWRAPAGHRVARADARGAAIAGPSAVIANMTEIATRRLATGTEVARIPVEPVHDGRWLVAPDRVYADRDGTRALVWYRGVNRGRVYDLTTGATLSSPDLPGPNLRRPELGVSLDGRRVVQLPTGAGVPTTVRVLDTASGRVVRELPVPAIPDAALSPDGDRGAFAFGDRDPILVRVATGERIALAPLDRAARHARFDPSGHRLILYGDRLARVVDADTGRTIADLPGLADAIEDARFTGDGHRVATWSDNRSAKLWDIDAGLVLIAVDGVPYGGVAVSPDGLRLATGADDGTIRIWDSATARLLELLHGDGPHISELAWSLDGTRLLASSNSTLHASIWDVHTETRSPEQIDELARRSAAYKLVDGLLVPAR